MFLSKNNKGIVNPIHLNTKNNQYINIANSKGEYMDIKATPVDMGYHEFPQQNNVNASGYQELPQQNNVNASGYQELPQQNNPNVNASGYQELPKQPNASGYMNVSPAPAPVTVPASIPSTTITPTSEQTTKVSNALRSTSNNDQNSSYDLSDVFDFKNKLTLKTLIYITNNTLNFLDNGTLINVNFKIIFYIDSLLSRLINAKSVIKCTFNKGIITSGEIIVSELSKKYCIRIVKNIIVYGERDQIIYRHTNTKGQRRKIPEIPDTFKMLGKITIEDHINNYIGSCRIQGDIENGKLYAGVDKIQRPLKNLNKS